MYPLLCKAINLRMFQILQSGNVKFCCLKVTYCSRSILKFCFENIHDTQLHCYAKSQDGQIITITDSGIHRLAFNSQNGEELFNSLSYPDQLCSSLSTPSPTQQIPNAILLRIQLLQNIQKRSHTEVRNSESFNITLIICCKTAMLRHVTKYCNMQLQNYFNKSVPQD